MSLIRTVRLKDQDAKLPMPGAPGSFAPQGPFEVNIMDPLWSTCLADGSVVVDEPSPEPEAPEPAKTAAKKPAEG